MKRSLLSLLLTTPLLCTCGGAGNYAETEAFASDARYRRDFPVAAPSLCDAARRVLLGDGYIVTRTDKQGLVGGKEFQIDENRQALLNLYVNCEPRADGATLFVTATEDHYDVKATRQSNSIGFPILAPLYFGTVLESDNQVKTRGETVTRSAFYEHFYRAVQRELPPQK
jgi:hypothetical protein